MTREPQLRGNVKSFDFVEQVQLCYILAIREGSLSLEVYVLVGLRAMP
jgi:hypothetical protein